MSPWGVGEAVQSIVQTPAGGHIWILCTPVGVVCALLVSISRRESILVRMYSMYIEDESILRECSCVGGEWFSLGGMVFFLRGDGFPWGKKGFPWGL